MAHPPATEIIASGLARAHRVMTLEGLAVIAHGQARPTFDADIWLDPNLGIAEWAAAIADVCSVRPCLRALSIGDWREIPPLDLPEVVERDGVIRLMGATQPLDIFRAPNGLLVEEFDDVWRRARPMEDGTRLPDPVDLLVSKQDTGREKDRQDILFLEAKAERDYLDRLPHAGEEEAAFMLGRFLTPRVAEIALDHPAPAIRALGGRFLRELAEEGSPFARDALVRRGLA